ncbi:MAG: hypothetical protein DHS20C16_10560 [Phycisphaerae bacterium]|nr:MAG: hypothetical protein DHS20C16_10560 [Phycisphaerae bacterium]
MTIPNLTTRKLATAMTKHQSFGGRWLVAIGMLATGLFPSLHAYAESGLTAAQRNDIPRHFGFDPLEIFKIEDGITQLRYGDLNNDGRMDLVLANNRKSTIEVLLQRETPPSEMDTPAEVNELVNDWRFERKRISVIWEVVCLQVADLTGDGNADLVFFGDPKELVILPGRGDGSFGSPDTRNVRDGLALPGSFDVGDINGDGRTDVTLLGESDLLIFRQRKDGGLEYADRFSHAVDNPRGVKLADLNGDERLDLVIFTSDEEYPLWLRYQDSRGHLGPVNRVKLPGLRSVCLASCLDRKANDLFGVERVSGRLKRWQIGLNSQTESQESAAVLYHPIPAKSDSPVLPLAIGDVTGDGLDDLITANIDAAQMILFKQEKDLGLLPPKLFGGQTKMRGARCYDVDGDGKRELYVVSANEDAIAVSRYEGDRLSFPKSIPVNGKPFAFDIGTLQDGQKPKLAYVSRNDDSEYHLHIGDLDGSKPADAEETDKNAVALEDIDEPPTAVRLADVNRDGRTDVLIFSSYAPLIACLQNEDGTFVARSKESGTQTGLVKQAKIEGYTYADTDGDGVGEVLLAQKKFVRALRINEQGAWETVDQYNAPGSDANITGIATVNMKNQKRPNLAMYDRQSREVHVLKPDSETTYTLDQSISVGLFDLQAMQATNLSGKNQTEILLADKQRIARVLPKTPAPQANEVGVYESSIKDARLTRIAVGDLNHDDRSDLVVVDHKDHAVEILTFGPEEELVRANKFRVFARKQFSRRGNTIPQPHWVEIVDLTNDGFDDLVMISQDRVLLYPSQ